MLTAGPFAVVARGCVPAQSALAMASTVLILVVAGVLIPQSTLLGAASAWNDALDGYASSSLAHFFRCHRYRIDLVSISRSPSVELEEFYMLILTATLGAMVMAAASHFATLILGLEILSISLYAMICYPQEGKLPLEAAAKYLVLSGVASTTMLFGIASSTRPPVR
ncbi:MAG: hypothetical protein Ct9H300mP8_03490 [Gammaproteobacteria bacterium]|nr:MAG: hypothetical protein Ct9H300mP8_03490 [Gammaproteobacteria bacterium]